MGKVGVGGRGKEDGGTGVSRKLSKLVSTIKTTSCFCLRTSLSCLHLRHAMRQTDVMTHMYVSTDCRLRAL